MRKSFLTDYYLRLSQQLYFPVRYIHKDLETLRASKWKPDATEKAPADSLVTSNVILVYFRNCCFIK